MVLQLRCGLAFPHWGCVILDPSTSADLIARPAVVGHRFRTFGTIGLFRLGRSCHALFRHRPMKPRTIDERAQS